MKKRVLYFNVISLLTPSCKEQIAHSTILFSHDLLEHIVLDQNAIALLTEFSQKTSVLLFPLQSRFHREFLIQNGFEDSVLAPDANYTVRRGDMNEVNHRIAHANAINSDWYIASDKYDKKFLEPHLSDRFVEIDAEGVSPKWIEMLINKFNSQ
ncbi:hypothetical protein RBG13_002913 [Vibrio cholerae]|nr:hypothetical protein [Vibrio cholerae]